MPEPHPLRAAATAAQEIADAAARHPLLSSAGRANRYAATSAEAADARWEAERTRSVADELGARADAFDAAAARHVEAEQTEASRLRDAGKTLQASRGRLVDAANAATTVLLRLYDAAAAHVDAVERTAAELATVGLVARVEDGDYHQDFPTGGLDGGEVLLRGVRWAKVDPVAVVARAAFGALAARAGTAVAATMLRTSAVREVEDSGVLAGAEPPPAFVPPPWPWGDGD